MRKLTYKYLVYIVYFLGVGLTSSGIVLMPFNAVRYSLILATGLSLFIAGSLINEIVIDKKNLTASETFELISLSLTLAIGIGMISGGISHFKESPTYVSYLIPLGFVISFISFTLKNKVPLSNKEQLLVLGVVNIIAIIIFIGLSIAASTFMDIPAGGDIFKGGH